MPAKSSSLRSGVMPPEWVTAAAHVVDQLLGDQRLVVPDGVEHLADRQRRGRVLAHDPQRLPGSRPGVQSSSQKRS